MTFSEQAALDETGICDRCGCHYSIGPGGLKRVGGQCDDLSWTTGKHLDLRRAQPCPGHIMRPDNLHWVPKGLAPLRGMLAAYHEPDGYGWVYFLCTETDVLYVGQTRHLQQRLAQHRQFGLAWIYTYTLEEHGSALLRVEQYWIRTLRPQWNWVRGE